VVRPDWYVYGTARNGRELAALLEQLAGSLQRQPVQAAAWRWPRRDRDGRPISIGRDVPALSGPARQPRRYVLLRRVKTLLAQSRHSRDASCLSAFGVKRTWAAASFRSSPPLLTR